MTPERLKQLREEADYYTRVGGEFMPEEVLELLDYIDTLHEELQKDPK